MRVPCTSKISPDCEQMIDIQALQEYDSPIICLPCAEYIKNLHPPKKNVDESKK